jgi:Carboxypeptidase regulatory-like domain/TonB dependent receptor/TonB-dependent Receptor Plug Domain
MKLQSIYKLCRAAVVCLGVSAMFSVEMPRSYAQADSGRIAGTITDSTGAAIPNATITLANPQTGLKLSGVSNGSGELNIPAVPQGTYTARVTATGFQAQTQQVTVAVTQNLTLNFKLLPGETTTTVEVTGAAALVDTTDATLGETIQGRQITELPLNGRNALNLALLTPGVTQGLYGDSSQDTVNRNGGSGGGALSVNGTRLQANNFILDGVDNNDGLQNNILFFPPVEATQEFQVTTSVAPAQYGRAGGALVIASIRSGSNQIHGSAFEFYRSGHFDANPNYQFQDAPFTPNPSYNRNQFGGFLGLPIIKDKLFIFGDYAGYREALPVAASYHTVPTALMRTGDFSELLNPALTGGTFITTFPKCVPNNGAMNNDLSMFSKGQIYDPQTCTPFAGNKIVSTRLNPAAVNYLNAYPMPTRTDRVLENYLAQQRAANKYNTFDTRLDWHPTNKDLLFFRSSYDNSTNTLTSVLGPALPAGSGSGSNYVHGRGYALGSTHTFSPRIVNELRVAYNRENFGYQPPNFGQNVSADLGIVNANRNADTTGGALIGGNNTEIEYTGDYGLYAVPENTYELTDTVNLTLGKHVIQTGGTFLRRQVEFFRPIAGKGFFDIAGNGVDFTGYEPTELLVGAVDNYQIGAQNGFFDNNSQEDALFIQDDWRLSQRLTLNLGIRWDLLTWPYEQHNQAAAFNPANGTVYLAGQNGIPRSIINQDYGNFAPRVGFAYSLTPDGRASLRGGYGIFYFPDYGGISNQLGQQPPFGGSVTYLANNGYCVTLTGQTTALGAPYSCSGYTSPGSVTTPLPAPGFPNFNPNSPPLGLSGLAVDRNNKHARLQEFNLQLQQQFGPRDVFSVAYVGVHSDRLSSYYPLNSYYFNTPTLPFENLGGISLNRYDGISNYDGLQVHFEHRAKDLLVTGSYAWSHSLDDSPGAFEGSTVSQPNNPLLNYGNSNQDVRHNFSTSALYNLPFGRGMRFDGNASRITDLLIGGFQLNLIALLASGQPDDVSTGFNTPGNRPDLVGALQYPKQIAGHWFNPNAFSTNIPSITSTDGKNATVYTRVGTAGRNIIFGPSSRVVNFGVQKNLHLSDRIALELHGDAFNVLNTPQFTNPGGSLNNLTTFGVITGLKANSARQIQLATRLTF